MTGGSTSILLLVFLVVYAAVLGSAAAFGVAVLWAGLLRKPLRITIVDLVLGTVFYAVGYIVSNYLYAIIYWENRLASNKVAAFIATNPLFIGVLTAVFAVFAYRWATFPSLTDSFGRESKSTGDR